MTAIKRSMRRPRARRVALVGVVATAGLVLAACGNNDTSTPEHHGAKASASATRSAGDNPAPGAFNNADVKFAQLMIPHHQQAVAMSELADGRAKDPQVKDLATEIEKAQGPEIEKMRSWLKAWGKPESSSSMPGMDHGSGSDSSSMPGMDHGSGSSDGSGMSGMMSAKDMDELKAATGTDFDTMFVKMMIDHHNGAIDMAEDEQKNGKNATAKKLADDVVKNQKAEVERMNKILDRL
ncbi:DUF305 domain-containing protein [Streptomyces sp. NPDC000151]|uniref:DUF305 domain-containing protein n=1 Tax=Streptomyces sp. NPDC000151 TaxID=3154244 RepID=UPI00331770B0